MSPALGIRVVSEAIATALLLTTVVGSGIMGEELAGGSVGLALLANALATGAGLVALILTFGPTSGAHMNPAVTLAFLLRRELAASEAALYVVAQVLGGLAGVCLAHAMFDVPLSVSAHERSGLSLGIAEAVATFGLVLVVLRVARESPSAVPYAVACYIVAAYWFTASTSFANPAVTIARALTNTFTGIRPVDVPFFVLAQVAGTLVAVALARLLERAAPEKERGST